MKLESRDRQDRLIGASELKNLGLFAAGAMKNLIEILPDEIEPTLGMVMDALVAIGKPAVADLALAGVGDDTELARLAVVILGRIGPAAAEAIPALEHAAASTDEELRKAAAESLERLR